MQQVKQVKRNAAQPPSPSISFLFSHWTTASPSCGEKQHGPQQKQQQQIRQVGTGELRHPIQDSDHCTAILIDSTILQIFARGSKSSDLNVSTPEFHFTNIKFQEFFVFRVANMGT
jgi:hypothetical protein